MSKLLWGIIFLAPASVFPAQASAMGRDSFEGADRGATKKAVYNGSRLRSMDPTRLFTDAQSTEEWRKKKFFSVTESKASGGVNDSIMIEILAHKINNAKSVGEYKSEADDLTCSQNPEELGGYLEKHPNDRMPFVTGDWPNTASTGPKTGSGIPMTGFKSDSMKMNR